MRHLVTTAIVTGLLLALGAASAQSASASHDVEAKLPNVLFLRITDGTGNGAATDPSVSFDYQADMTLYLAALEAGGGDLEPTTVTDFGDVIVFANRGTWSVTVEATPIVHLSLGGTLDASGIALADIKVAPASGPHEDVKREASWTLATASSIASGGRTLGWKSLGFSGADYRLVIDGDEDPGTYTTTVTYTIAAP